MVNGHLEIKARYRTYHNSHKLKTQQEIKEYHDGTSILLSLDEIQSKSVVRDMIVGPIFDCEKFWKHRAQVRRLHAPRETRCLESDGIEDENE